ncbi:hypothetical protein ACFP67_14065 [Mammaliicoccus sciuri]|uniref:hypothetical protein n=1 Tax=Mammaliicoccus sciuri TaxID=1296 RepID=UPI000CD00C80|nr:hypothetical protein [Mammaliicoccus sciuri]PNZ30005.1 hypothetical protein CD114_01245 [Mammaliicoccus sciuri]
MLENFLQEAVQEIEKQTGKDVDLENNTYILQTKSAWLKLGLDDDENGEKQLQVHVIGGKVTFLETENDIFGELYGGNDDDTTN